MRGVGEDMVVAAAPADGLAESMGEERLATMGEGPVGLGVGVSLDGLAEILDVDNCGEKT
jgi:hypothetical protein